LSADEPAVDPGGVFALAPVNAVDVDEVLADKHTAIRRAAPTTKLTTWRCPRRRRDRDCPMNVLMSFLRSSIK
jgi:hypothetical protein